MEDELPWLAPYRDVVRVEAGVDRRRHPGDRELECRAVGKAQLEPLRSVRVVAPVTWRIVTPFSSPDPEKLAPTPPPMRARQPPVPCCQATQNPPRLVGATHTNVSLPVGRAHRHLAGLHRDDAGRHPLRRPEVEASECELDAFRRRFRREEVDHEAVQPEGDRRRDDGRGDDDERRGQRATAPCAAHASRHVAPVRCGRRVHEQCEALGEQRVVGHRASSSTSDSSNAARAWASDAATVPSEMPSTSAMSR